MGVGLQRGSPVQLSLSKDNYVALIERHGQWTRWRTAAKCSCLDSKTMQPNVRCKICSGRGIYYTNQKDQVLYQSVMLRNDNKTLQVDDKYKDCSLIQVYDYHGDIIPAEKLGTFIKLNTENKLIKGSYFNIVMRQEIEEILSAAICNKKEMGFYKVPGLQNSKANIDGIYYTSPSDILSIEKIIDADGVEYEATEFRLDTFRIKLQKETVEDIDGNEIEREILPAEPLTVQGVHYIRPFIFAILNQNLSQADVQAVVDVQGDAIVTYPYELDVSNDDVLTVLAGAYTQKEAVCRSDYETDTLGVYFVYDVINCTGIVDGKLIEYKEGEDYILVGTNKIKWLEDSENIPESGDAYSISYHVLPTYKVVKQIPTLRTSENQRFPKKAVVKLFSTYSENLGVNKQPVGRKGLNGSV